MSAAATMLSVIGIEVIYNHVILVLKGVSLTVREGGIVALLGASPGASTAAFIAIELLRTCFADKLTAETWLPKLQQIIPTYGIEPLFVGPDLGHIHGLNEYVSVKSLLDGRNFLYLLVKAYADQT